MVSVEFRRKALECVDERRRAHVEGTAQTAVSLALRWGVDPDAAETAALLHDCTKRIKDSEQLKLCAEYGIIVTQAERASPGILHALSGAVFAKREFGASQEIADAIRTHTTGAPGMTPLQKIIYLADFIEPSRSFPGIDEIRALAGKDLTAAVAAAAASTISYLCAHMLPVYPVTVDTYNSLLYEKEYNGNR